MRSEALLLSLLDSETVAQRSEHSPSGGRAGPKNRASPRSGPRVLTPLPAGQVPSASAVTHSPGSTELFLPQGRNPPRSA